MSRYLIRRIEESPDIVFQPQTEIVDLAGSGYLERVSWQDNQTGMIETNDIRTYADDHRHSRRLVYCW
jgi:thioredoxin reductase (NADPH)